tara:strand:+ start:5030 stop:5896 length:867 start_codon:yes stop_codon:yes gene_type:complete
MKSILIICTGFIGDVLMASSIAKKLKDEEQFQEVDFVIPVLQPLELLNNNPFINNVYFGSEYDKPNKDYDKVVVLPEVNQGKTPPYQFQEAADVNNPSSEYRVYTNPALDYSVQLQLHTARGSGPIIAWQSNWEEKSFGFTEEEYKRGINVPELGYGGRRRDIKYIVDELNKEFPAMIEVGLPVGTNVHDVGLVTTGHYSMTASILKYCDYFIGGEGGLCNLAAGVGTKTIITGDFVHQLYGWNGVIKKIEKPKLGPEFYFKEGHRSLNPYLLDKEVVDEMIKIIGDI